MYRIYTGNGKQFSAGNKESILEAANNAGIFLSYSCRNGRCGSCKAILISGQCHSEYEEIGLSKKEREEGWILTCMNTARSDLQIEAQDLGQLSLLPAKIVPARIISIEKVSHDVMKVILRIPPSQNLEYYPGQYIEFIGLEGARRSYSLAKASADDKLLEFHISDVPGGTMSSYWFCNAKVDDLVRINGPLGTFFLRNIAGLDLVFMATGTGIAPVKAMLEGLQTLKQGDQPRSVTVYWGRRKQSELYQNIVSNLPNFRYIPVLSRAGIEWNGAQGYVQKAHLDDTRDQSNHVVYASGSEAMIRSAKRELIAAGLPENRFYSEAFVSSSSNIIDIGRL